MINHLKYAWKNARPWVRWILMILGYIAVLIMIFTIYCFLRLFFI